MAAAISAGTAGGLAAVARSAFMKCPHCLTAFHDAWSEQPVGVDTEGLWVTRATTCPACNRLVIILVERHRNGVHKSTRLVQPKGIARAPIPAEVPSTLAEDFNEACRVFPDSEKASAALSRRCLQNLLRERAGVKPTNLDSEIQQVLDSKQLPWHLADSVDAVRAVGISPHTRLRAKALVQLSR